MSEKVYYLIIGRGRVARHFQHYFSILNLSFDIWDRSQALTILEQKLSQASHVLILVSDAAIETVAQSCLHYQSQAILLHCAGSLSSSFAYGVHPLMSFNKTLYDLHQYQEMAFIIDNNAPDFEILLPGLSNPHARLDKKLKAQYHALCVLSGNFSCLLWQKLFSTLESWDISPDLAKPFMMRQMQNLKDDYATALTGPLVRKDVETIEKNINALNGDPFEEVYKSFVTAYQLSNTEKTNENK